MATCFCLLGLGHTLCLFIYSRNKDPNEEKRIKFLSDPAAQRGTSEEILYAFLHLDPISAPPHVVLIWAQQHRLN